MGNIRLKLVDVARYRNDELPGYAPVLRSAW